MHQHGTGRIETQGLRVPPSPSSITFSRGPQQGILCFIKLIHFGVGDGYQGTGREELWIAV